MSVESVTTLPGTRYERQTAWLVQAHDHQHGTFAELLARAFTHADLDNKMKLANGFPELFDSIVSAD